MASGVGFLGLIAALPLAGCASNSGPARTTLTEPSGPNLNIRHRASATDGTTSYGPDSLTYPIPISKNSNGKITVISHGIQEIRVHRSEQRLPALHVGLIVSNPTGKHAWLLDARTQELVLRGNILLRPALVQAKALALPMVEIKPGQTEIIDLYYALPKQMRNLPDIPGFELRWQIQTHTTLVAHTADFEQKLKTTDANDVYPFERPEASAMIAPDSVMPRPTELGNPHTGQMDRPVDYPAMDPSLDPVVDPFTPDSIRQLQEVPGRDLPNWWADPFTEFPFPWRDMMY